VPSCPITNEGSFLETFLYALDCLHIEDFVLNEFGGNTCLSLFLLKEKKSVLCFPCCLVCFVVNSLGPMMIIFGLSIVFRKIFFSQLVVLKFT